MSKNRPEPQTVAEVKDAKETSLLQAGKSPAEARNEVSRLGLAVKKRRDTEAALAALIEKQDTLLLAEIASQLRDIVAESNIFVTDKPSILSKFDSLIGKLQDAAKKSEAAVES